ncbi:hypothetical protein ONE63_009110 [Megalurothrips usitatus]|uniref:Uncharacterized protein n=1 Tax=Megalurothrips usitatus TaxID=439358 RepID=A0AAV7XNB6_9NEOP|nr:hypothetical protein ONE63_009110 [Megalurothrips usitatus]
MPQARHAARHARHAGARVQTRVLARQPSRQPWQNPCGTAVPVAPITPPARNLQLRPKAHKASAAQDFDWPPPSMDGKGWSLRTVRGRIRVARAHLRYRRKHIHQVYGQVKVLSNKYSFDWLPSQQVPWYRSEVTCLDRDSQAAQVLPALRSALQNFSATFVELQKARRWTIDGPGLNNRSLIINELASHVKGMLCEVETAMQDRGLPLPPSGLPSDGLADVDPSRWNPNPDLTGALIQDWGVVSAYTDALYGWALILRELGHAPKVRRQGDLADLEVAVVPGGCPQQSPPHRLHGRHRNQLQRKQRRHPGGGPGGDEDARRRRRRRRRRRKQQRERRHQRRRLMEEMAKRNGGRPWRPARPPHAAEQRPPRPGARPGRRPGRRPGAAGRPRTPARTDTPGA